MNTEYNTMSEPKKRVVVNNGYMHKVQLPEGASSVIDLVRQGMQLYPASTDTGAKAVGLYRQTYSLVRKLLLLRARQVLTTEEDETAAKALAIINTDLRYQPAETLVQPILEKYWASGTHHGEYRAKGMVETITRKKERKVFDNTLFAIREACTNNQELDIPANMSRPEKENARNTILESIGHLTVLMQRIMGEQK
jgi:hypothetical protein